MIRDIPESVPRLVRIREIAVVAEARRRWGLSWADRRIVGIGEIVGRSVTDSGVTLMLRIRTPDGKVELVQPDRVQLIAPTVTSDLSIPPVPLHAVTRCRRMS